MQLCNILYVLICHLVWKHLGILTCFKLISPERIKNMDKKNVHFSEIHGYYLAVLVIQWGFYIWDWCRQPLLFFTVQELCGEHVTIYMFVSVLCSILKCKLLPCFVFLFCHPNYFILPHVSWTCTLFAIILFCPLCQCIQFQGSEFFNSLSHEIQNSESVGLFGKDLKSSFFLSHIIIHCTLFLLFFNLLINHFSF